MTDQFAAAKERRQGLQVAPNPRPGIDYLVTLGGTVALPAGPGAQGPEAPVTVRVRYVPDRHILAASVFGTYLSALEQSSWDSLEVLGVAILGDLNSELVPRWMQVILVAKADANEYSVMLEDRQPRWDNPRLLSRLMLF